MVVDFGGHLYPGGVHPPSVTDSPVAQKLGPLLTDVDALLGYIDDSPLDGMVLSQPYYMRTGDLASTEEANRTLLQSIETHGCLYALAAVPIDAGGAAAASELNRALSAGFHGGAVEVSPGATGLTDEAYEPVLDVADSHGAPLLVHPKLDDSLSPGVLDDSYRLNAIFGRELALMNSISTVIHGELFDSYPALKLVYHHFGGNIASMIGRIQLQLDSERWASGGTHKEFDAFSETLAEHIYVDTSGFFGHETPLQAALSEMPPEHILFGSDYPYEPRTPAEMTALIRAVTKDTTAAASEQILGDNARRILLT